jgi:hypothetical protein
VSTAARRRSSSVVTSDEKTPSDENTKGTRNKRKNTYEHHGDRRPRAA